jgi:hypothetical protein
MTPTLLTILKKSKLLPALSDRLNTVILTLSLSMALVFLTSRKKLLTNNNTPGAIRASQGNEGAINPSMLAMTNHPNRNWKRRWTVNIETASAEHDCGLIVQYLALPLTEEQKQAHDGASSALGKCWTDDGREWGIVTTPVLLYPLFEALKEEHGLKKAQMRIARLAREAGEVWASRKAQEH